MSTLAMLLNDFIYKQLLDINGQVTLNSPSFPVTIMEILGTPSGEALLKAKKQDSRTLYKELKSYQNFNDTALETMVQLLNQFLVSKGKQLRLEDINIFAALRWTIAQLDELFQKEKLLEPCWDGNSPAPMPGEVFAPSTNFIKLLALSKEYTKPVRQCRMCARQDIDKRGKHFLNRSITCHVHDCVRSSSTLLKEHGEGCCFKAWLKLKQSFRHQFKELNKLQKLSTPKALREKNIQQKITALINNLYRQNLSLTQPIRALKEKPGNTMFVVEGRMHAPQELMEPLDPLLAK